MAIMKVAEIREMEEKALEGKLAEIKKELNAERGVVASGGRASNAGRIAEMRRTIARIITILRERKNKKAGAVPKK